MKMNEEMEAIEKKLEKHRSGKLRTYQSRPECNKDADVFIELAGDKISDIKYVIIPDDMPYALMFPGKINEETNKPMFYESFKFKSTLSYHELLEIMRGVPDGHILMQTLAFEDDYTGDRDYDIK